MTDENVSTEARIDISDPVRTVRVQRRVDGEPYRVYRAWASPDAQFLLFIYASLPHIAAFCPVSP